MTTNDKFKYAMPLIWGALAFVIVYSIYPVPLACIVVGGGVVFWQWDKIPGDEGVA